MSSVLTGQHQKIVIGQVLGVHVSDEYVLDKEKAYLDTPAFDLVARSFGSDYVRTKDVFTLERPVWEE